MSKPLILLTNDDGFDSPGLIELASQFIEEYEVLVVAPLEHHSGTGRGVPFGASYKDQGSIEKHTIQLTQDRSLTFYSVDGTPALSVAHAVLEIAPRKPDFCVSGINFGENLGKGLHYSGTVGAAMEAATFDIPTIAISQEMNLEDVFLFKGDRSMFSVAAKIAKNIVKKLLAEPLNSETVCLNVNVPRNVDSHTKWELTFQSRKDRWEWTKPASRDLSKPFQLLCHDVEGVVWEQGSDCHALLTNGNVSITPLSYLMEARDEEVDEKGLKKLIN